MPHCHICQDLQLDRADVGLFSQRYDADEPAGVSIAELLKTAEPGCPACSILRDGMITFESLHNIDRVEYHIGAFGLNEDNQFIVKMCFRDGRSETLEFYTSLGTSVFGVAFCQLVGASARQQ